MKSIIIVAILLGATLMVLAESDVKDLSKDFLKQCQIQEGASEDDLEPFRKKTKPETFKSKCVLACINEKFDFTKDGFVNEDKIDELAAKFYPDPTKSTVWSEATRECKDVKSDNRCDRTWELAECIFDSIRRRGLEPKSFFV